MNLTVMIATTLASLILFNEDSDNLVNPCWRRNADRMTEEDVRTYYEDVLGAGKVTHFLLCVNARASAYPSKVFDNYWDCVKDPDVKLGTNVRPLIMKDMFDCGVDRFAIGVEMCRAKGVQPWLSFRMNDIHFVTDKTFWLNFGHWKAHPELWIVPSSASNAAERAWWPRAYDYRKEPVQARMLAYIEEALGRYDADGIELDWMRFEYHMPRDTVRGEGAEALNRFMRRAREVVRAAEKRRGHSIRIAARVDSDPESALNHGTDYRVWAREKLVDLLIPCNFFSTIDFELPFTVWRDEVKALNPDVRVIPGLDCGVTEPGRKRRYATADEYAAWAGRMYSGGATGIYFFNLFCYPVDHPGEPRGEVWDWVTKKGFTPESVAAHAKSVPKNALRECVTGGWCAPRKERTR